MLLFLLLRKCVGNKAGNELRETRHRCLCGYREGLLEKGALSEDLRDTRE